MNFCASAERLTKRENGKTAQRQEEYWNLMD